MVLATPPLGYAACCAALRDMDQRESDRTIKAPTLVVVGDKDPATPPERGRQIHELVPGSEMVDPRRRPSHQYRGDQGLQQSRAHFPGAIGARSFA